MSFSLGIPLRPSSSLRPFRSALWLSMALPLAALHGAERMSWKCSTRAAVWQDREAVTMNDHISPPSAAADRVLVDSQKRLQTIDGWGGCFNERGWKAMEVLSASQRDEVLHALFDPTNGLKLGIGRTPIGASDYAITLYSLDESKDDYAMKQFSIARDRERLIPYIRAALAIRPDLELWGVPWSPPSWMKTNNNLVSGNIRADDRTLAALALYFARYIEEYRKEGIRIGMVMPQNEPNISSNYTSCQWTGEELARFVGHHLGPVLEQRKSGARIFLGGFNESSRGGYSYWVAPSMNDPQTRKYIAGVGCQWDANWTMSETHFLHPELKLMQTETECGKTNSNDWAFAEYQYQLARKWFEAGAGSNIIWNLVLDETGRSTGGWNQCSPIVIDTRSRKVIYTPFYSLYRHFSHFITPGARFAATHGSWNDKLAFTNPDGSVVLVMGNSANQELPVNIEIDGRQSGRILLPGHSFNTFVLPRGN